MPKKALPPRNNKHKKAYQDSIILKSRSFEHLFLDKNEFEIIVVKGMGIRKLYLWIKDFGTYVNRNIIEAKAVHCHKGIVLALVRYSSNQSMQNLIFAGLNGYTEKSEFRKELLLQLWDKLQYCYVTRVDIAKDFFGKTPASILKKLSTMRAKLFHYKHSAYYKTKNEKKSNPRQNIVEYDKSYKDKLKIKIRRLEFVYRGNYFSKVMLKDLHLEFERIEKNFKRFTGNTISIVALSSL